MTPAFAIILLAVTFSLPLLPVLQGVLGTLLPLLVGLVTTYETRPTVRALLLLGLSAITGGLTELIASLTNGTDFDAGVWLLGAVIAYAAGIAAHFGIWRPTGTTDKALAVGSRYVVDGGAPPEGKIDG